MSKIKRFLTGTLIAVLLLGTAACGRQEAAPAAQEVTEPQQATGEVLPTADRQAQLADAKEKNPDTAAWLYIPGVEVDDPVMQAADNGYYLQKDENGSFSEWGCYYAHCDDHLGSRSPMPPRESKRVIYAKSEFSIVAATYFYYVGLDEPMLQELNRLDAIFTQKTAALFFCKQAERSDQP